MSIVLAYWLAFVMGIIVGSAIMFIFLWHINVAGTLKIDHSNPQKDVYRFVIDNFDVLFKKKRIILRVDNNANLSQ